jgi:hypothetical protein
LPFRKISQDQLAALVARYPFARPVNVLDAIERANDAVALWQLQDDPLIRLAGLAFAGWFRDLP